MLTIDGSFGEGGGQILRSSLALSMVTGTPFRIERIRANRDKPGLQRQHLTAVTSAAQVCGAKVDGAALGSSALTFEPGPVVPGAYHFSTGGAGSTTLVLQTVLPALLRGDKPSRLTLEGGTHNVYAPPLDFLAKAFIPIINRMGPRVTVTLERPGFYPAGGGRFVAEVHPALKLNLVDLPERGAVVHRLARAVVARLPKHIAEKEISTVEDRTGWGNDCFAIEEWPAEYGPGNILTIEVGSEHVTEVFTGFGQRGVPAATVAEFPTEQMLRYLRAGVPVGDCLADQLLLPFALAGGGSYTTLALTRHAATNIEVIRKFLDVQVTVTELGPDVTHIDVRS